MNAWKRLFFDLVKIIRKEYARDNRWDPNDHPQGEGGRFVYNGGKKKQPRKFDRSRKHKTVQLSPAEAAMVRHELNTHLSKEERKKFILQKPIRNYLYTVENHGFDNYRIIEKMPLE